MQYGVYKHKPMSSIIASSADDEPEAPTSEKPEAADDLPEKYRGKTEREIAEMHMNSERRLGQLQNEVGQLRGLVQDLAQVQRASPPRTPEMDDVKISGDELIANPADAIRKVVQPLVEKKKEPEAPDPTDQALYAMEQNSLISDFGDVQSIAGSQEFKDFIGRTHSRQADYERACDPTLGIEQVRAARRLLEDFTDFKSSLPTSDAEKRKTAVEQAKSVANEGPGPSGPIQTKQLIHEADVIALINSNPAKYRSPSFQKELHEAIRDGRYVKMGG